MFTKTYPHALTNWLNNVARFQQKKAPDTGFQHTTHSEPIVQLWILRLLVPLECHRKFIGRSNYDNEEIARMLGLQIDDANDVRSYALINISIYKSMR